MNPLAESANILFVYHRLDALGGIETRFIDEFKYLEKNNFNVFLFVDKNALSQQLASNFTHCKILSEPISKLTNVNNFVSLVETLIYYIEAHNIQLISIHMLNWFGFAGIIAAQLTKTPVISTIHGILEIYNKPINRILLQYLSARSIGLQVFVSDLPKSASIPSITKHSIKIPNLINFKKYKSQSINTTNKWMMVSRISAEKYPSILRFVKLAHDCCIPEVDIAGGGDTKKLLKLTNRHKYQVKINFLGQCEDVPKLMQEYELIAGMGRVAIEGLACKRKVCIITPDGQLKGLVTGDNFQRLANYNFTGNTLKSITTETFKNSLVHITQDEIEVIYQLLIDTLSTENWDKYIKIYREVLFIDNPPLESLFHKMSYFSKNISQPFEKDRFFQFIIEEIILEHQLTDVDKIMQFYKKSKKLRFKYPNPFKIKKYWW